IGVEALDLRVLGFFQHGVSFAKRFAVFCHAHAGLSCPLAGVTCFPDVEQAVKLVQNKTRGGSGCFGCAPSTRFAPLSRWRHRWPTPMTPSTRASDSPS